jgi:hypothetical protein
VKTGVDSDTSLSVSRTTFFAVRIHHENFGVQAIPYGLEHELRTIRRAGRIILLETGQLLDRDSLDEALRASEKRRQQNEHNQDFHRSKSGVHIETNVCAMGLLARPCNVSSQANIGEKTGCYWMLIAILYWRNSMKLEATPYMLVDLRGTRAWRRADWRRSATQMPP